MSPIPLLWESWIRKDADPFNANSSSTPEPIDTLYGRYINNAGDAIEGGVSHGRLIADLAHVVESAAVAEHRHARGAQVRRLCAALDRDEALEAVRVVLRVVVAHDYIEQRKQNIRG